jgi:hypothetical protein
MKHPVFYSQQSTRVNHPGLFNCKGVKKNLYPEELSAKENLIGLLKD